MNDSYVEIVNLMAQYSHRLDQGDFDGVGAVLHDCELISEGAGYQVQGGAAIADAYRRIVRTYENGSPRTRHVTTNVHLDITGDTAEGVAYFTVLQQVEPDFPMQVIVCGTYFDSFAHDADGWRFTRRRMARGLTGDMSRHLRFDAIAALNDAQSVT